MAVMQRLGIPQLNLFIDFWLFGSTLMNIPEIS